MAEASGSVDLGQAKERSRATWEAMAPGWERNRSYIWDASAEVGAWMVEVLDPRPGQTVLDIAAGPGDTGFLAAARVGPTGRLICTDFAAEMVEVARRRAKELGLDNVELRVLDAERMDLPDRSVDGVLCRWGYMLMFDQAAALRETRRVLRPGGKLVFSVWGPMAENMWVVLPGMVAIGRGLIEPVDPTAPGGMFSMADTEKVRSMVSAAGFGDVAVEAMSLQWRFEDFDELWRFYTELAGAMAQLIRSLPESEVDAVRTDLREKVEPFRAGEGYEFPALCLNVVAS